MNTTFGSNIWWTIPETSIDRNFAVQVLESNGFDISWIKEPTRRLEVSRAVHSFHDRRSAKNRRIGEKVQDNIDSAVFGILDLERESGDEVSFKQNTTIRLDKMTGVVTASGFHAETFEKALEEFSGKITDDDIRMFLRRVISNAYGVAKRPTGGIYFVPTNHIGVVERAQAVLVGLNSSAHMYMERVMDGVQERANVWDSVQLDVSTKLTEAVAAIGRIDRRVSAVESQSEKIDEAQELMEVYKGLLGEEAKYQELTEQIEQAVQAVSSKMIEISNPTVAKIRKHRTPKKNRRGNLIMEAAMKVLTETKAPMSYKEIAEEAVKQSLIPNPCASISVQFSAELNKAFAKGENRFARVARGIYQAV